MQLTMHIYCQKNLKMANEVIMTINMKRNGIDNAYLLPTEFHKQIATRCVSKGHFIKPLK